jgi:alkylation response protein AidB-like acyl-CoA dehydrogenase
VEPVNRQDLEAAAVNQAPEMKAFFLSSKGEELIFQIYEGTSQIQRVIIAKEIFSR